MRVRHHRPVDGLFTDQRQPWRAAACAESGTVTSPSATAAAAAAAAGDGACHRTATAPTAASDHKSRLRLRHHRRWSDSYGYRYYTNDQGPRAAATATAVSAAPQEGPRRPWRSAVVTKMAEVASGGDSAAVSADRVDKSEASTRTLKSVVRFRDCRAYYEPRESSCSFLAPLSNRHAALSPPHFSISRARDSVPQVAKYWVATLCQWGVLLGIMKGLDILQVATGPLESHNTHAICVATEYERRTQTLTRTPYHPYRQPKHGQAAKPGLISNAAG